MTVWLGRKSRSRAICGVHDDRSPADARNVGGRHLLAYRASERRLVDDELAQDPYEPLERHLAVHICAGPTVSRAVVLVTSA